MTKISDKLQIECVPLQLDRKKNSRQSLYNQKLSAFKGCKDYYILHITGNRRFALDATRYKGFSRGDLSGRRQGPVTILPQFTPQMKRRRHLFRYTKADLFNFIHFTSGFQPLASRDVTVERHQDCRRSRHPSGTNTFPGNHFNYTTQRCSWPKPHDVKLERAKFARVERRSNKDLC